MTIDGMTDSAWDFMQKSTMWNSSAFFVQVTPEMVKKDEQFKNNKVGDWVTKGNVTEQATLNFFLKCFSGDDMVGLKKQLVDVQETVIAFTSARKKASVIVRTDSGYTMYTKGGPDFLGRAVTHIVGSDG